MGLRKFKGKITFCISCAKIEHFVSECPYARKEDSDDDEEYNNEKCLFLDKYPLFDG